MAKKGLNPKRLKKYAENLVKNDYSVSDEDTVEEFSNTIVEYALSAKLTTYKEVTCYIDGLLTPLDTEVFGSLID